MSARKAEVISFKVKSKRLSVGTRSFLRHWLNRMFGFSRFNACYASLPPCTDRQLSSHFLNWFDIHIDADGAPIDHAPRDRPVIFLANHPTGLVDAFALDALINPAWPDCRFMSVYVLGEIPEYRNRIFMVDPARKPSRQRMNAQAWRDSYRLLRQGGVLAVFPAGAVAHFDWRSASVRDKDWSPHVAALARKTRATIVPIFIRARSSWSFRLAGVLFPQMRNLLLFKEPFKLRGRRVRVTVGEPISPETFDQCSDDVSLITSIREATEALAVSAKRDVSPGSITRQDDR